MFPYENRGMVYFLNIYSLPLSMKPDVKYNQGQFILKINRKCLIQKRGVHILHTRILLLTGASFQITRYRFFRMDLIRPRFSFSVPSVLFQVIPPSHKLSDPVRHPGSDMLHSHELFPRRSHDLLHAAEMTEQIPCHHRPDTRQ